MSALEDPIKRDEIPIIRTPIRIPTKRDFKDIPIGTRPLVSKKRTAYLEYEHERRKGLRDSLENFYGGKEAVRKEIKEAYRRMKDNDHINIDIRNALLRNLTYEKNRPLNYSGTRIVRLLDDYIHAYGIDLDKDVTLEEAVNSI